MAEARSLSRPDKALKRGYGKFAMSPQGHESQVHYLPVQARKFLRHILLAKRLPGQGECYNRPGKELGRC
jgi:hypothetical protein